MLMAMFLCFNNLRSLQKNLSNNMVQNRFSPPYISRGTECAPTWRSATPAHNAADHETSILQPSTLIHQPSTCMSRAYPNLSESIRTLEEYFFSSTSGKVGKETPNPRMPHVLHSW